MNVGPWSLAVVPAAAEIRGTSAPDSSAGSKTAEATGCDVPNPRQVRQNPQAARIALEGVGQEALAGSRNVLDLLDAEQALLDARVSLMQARCGLVVATYALRSAVAKLAAESLESNSTIPA